MRCLEGFSVRGRKMKHWNLLISVSALSLPEVHFGLGCRIARIRPAPLSGSEVSPQVFRSAFRSRKSFFLLLLLDSPSRPSKRNSPECRMYRPRTEGRFTVHGATEPSAQLPLAQRVHFGKRHVLRINLSLCVA